MGSVRRIINVIVGILTILGGVAMILHPDVGYIFVVLFIVISLLLYGIQLLFYYFTMARYMVGGISVFYRAVIVFDIGLFTLNLSYLPKKYAFIYLIAGMAFSGVIDMLHAREGKGIGSDKWTYELSYGLIKIGLAITCLFFLDSVKMLTYIYCIGLFHSALTRIETAFRKTAIVYIE